MSSEIKVRGSPSGIHLFDRQTGTNILLDEVTVPPTAWAAAPRQVSVALTNACDLACSYCYAPKQRAKLDIQRLTRWLDELDIHGCLGVGFGGGEPTLYKHFVELCRHAAQKTKLAVTFTTHGHRLDDKLITALVGNVHFVRISMDGVGATYEQNRKKPYASLLSALDKARSLAPFGINFVVNAHTVSDLDAAISLAHEKGAEEFLLLPEQPAKGRSGIDAHTSSALKRWVSEYRGTIPLVISQGGSDGFPICDPLEQETGLSAYAHIDALGVLKRTSFSREGVEINDQGVMKALEILKAHHEE